MDALQDERDSSGSSGLISLDHRLAKLSSLTGNNAVDQDQLLPLVTRGHALKTMLMRPSEGSAQTGAAKQLRTELEVDAEQLETRLRGKHQCFQQLEPASSCTPPP